MSFLLNAFDLIPGASQVLDPMNSILSGIPGASLFGFVPNQQSSQQSNNDFLGIPIKGWFIIGGGLVIVVLLVKNKSSSTKS